MAVKTKTGITLTTHQQAALEQLHDFLDSPERLFVLEGYAGTGKTTLLQAFVSQLQDRGDRRAIVFSAFTNKATKVLNQMVSSWGLSIECLTCCQLLGLRPQIDPETGEQDFVPEHNEESSFGKFALVVVDECSMVNRNLWELLQTELSAFHLTTQLLFVGDVAQLPPINEPASPTFLEISNKAQLTEVVRYGSSIGVLAESVRCHLDIHQLPTFHTDLNDDKTEGTVVLRQTDWTKQLLRAFTSEKGQDDSDYVRALAYTNRRVAHLNQQIRNAIFGADAYRFVPGERLIAMSPVFRRKDEILMPTSSECWVEDAEEDDSSGWRVWRLFVVTDANFEAEVTVLHESEQQRFQQELRRLAEGKQWQDFWLLKQQRFANLNYSYALTVHKSQGSTFQNVFVDLPNLMRNRNIRERNQLLYVAVTRAAKRLFICQAR
ncbi:AAA family ATPase [Acaryochloris sp. IP29b_bin.148]|uniref:ATP-dependent DNA helicase n=1 Tax=Acaryochloris sp. IP29b_bin.148 TaxID=2969218 RepID=UPI00262CE360|nr:AAA family ATPase [Acaryochloris sp. IP29b_bin.148]